MNISRRKFSLLAFLTTPLLFLVSCGTSAVIQALQLAVDAASIAIPLVASVTGVPPQTVALLLTYLEQVSRAIDGAATILASAGTPAQHAVAILALFAGIAIPDLTGIPAAIVSAVKLVAERVAAFLANFNQSKLNAMGVQAQQPQTVSSGDRAKLAGIGAKAQANLAAIAKAKKP
jgi:phage-related protein